MNILLTGATGFIGSHLIARLQVQGHQITALVRHPARATALAAAGVQVICRFDELPPDRYFDAVINLAGAPVIGPRWSAARKAELLASREGLTQSLGRWMAQAQRAPGVLINASAIGFYGSQGAQELDEQAPASTEFMSELCQRWEQAAKVAASRSRLVIYRFGVVFGADGGALPKMLLPFHLRCGTVYGDGQQYLSWIHLDDLLDALQLALNDDSMQGAYNLTAPEPVSQLQFARSAAAAIGGKAWLHLPAGLLKLLMGEAATLFVDGQRVVPKRLQAHGFKFAHPRLQEALAQLLAKPRG